MKLPPFRHRPFGEAAPVRQVRRSDLTGKWTRIRRLHLMRHPACAQCGLAGREVHHILPRESHPHLKYAWENLQTLCAQCHKEIHRDF
jgi:5-methylcytosine-specific restriction endonuclease McrA